VGSFAPNPFGLFDTAGNVWEWVADNYQINYHGAPNNGSAWKKSSKSRRGIRGGSWDNRPFYVSSAGRTSHLPDVRGRHIGFRVVGAVRAF
jgi:formylglycine-generating enzyme required for sulfatase activity